MKCFFCGGETKIIDSRVEKAGRWRRRKCKDCGHITHTIEKVDIKRMRNEKTSRIDRLRNMSDEDIADIINQRYAAYNVCDIICGGTEKCRAKNESGCAAIVLEWLKAKDE